ncbi:aldo/keto reductase [Paenibacillus sp. 19GGS1-52]|uniref:aldo/keto reductase n=1 Tax=Paenibacillus sp. 19GGS1-52 TaxID=2758563 RepID=UPI001EFBCDAD|nr:aldo/keto reductase [Paenibacillus sp. 19GGS1-52]ULO08161.1 aldo/keto reductase [Paenibacillus sp. 19GGS1-52]
MSQSNNFRTLGRSGLIVSPLALGTMTFGNARWGSPDDVSEAIFDEYIHSGGNFIDTSDVYAKGRSEELLGSYIADRGLRDQLVIASKFGFQGGDPINVNSGGNGRKNIYRALEGSLRRLRTDYIDLYWLHVWDLVTPIEEVLQTLGDLVRAGKIRYFGFSNLPAWYVTKGSVLATAHNIPGPIALQLEYSLVERSCEREHLPAAKECGLGVCSWSPLAGGLLAGKYQLEGENVAGEGRLDTLKGGNNRFQKITGENWNTLSALRTVSAEVNRPMAQVALAWASAQPGISSLILGASKLEQLQDNLASLDIELTKEQLQVLDESSALDHTYMIYTDKINRGIFAGSSVQGWM